MADASEVFAGITRRPGVRYTALVPNLRRPGPRGRGRACDEVAVFAAACETFSAATSISRSTSRWPAIATSPPTPATHGLPVRGYVSCAFGCPFEGAVAPARGGARDPARCSISASTRWRSATPSASPIPGRSGRCSPTSPAQVAASAAGAALPRHARHGAGQRAGGARRRRRHLRRVGRRPGRLSVRAGRVGQPRHRRPALPAATAWASRPASRCRR